MVKINAEGVVAHGLDGKVLTNTYNSAHSKKRAVVHGVNVPVPDAPGLFIRLDRREAKTLDDKQMKTLFERAIVWADAHVTWPEPSPDSEALTIDDVTMEELLDLARELDIPGRSKMDKEALFEAVSQAAGVQD